MCISPCDLESVGIHLCDCFAAAVRLHSYLLQSVLKTPPPFHHPLFLPATIPIFLFSFLPSPFFSLVDLVQLLWKPLPKDCHAECGVLLLNGAPPCTNSHIFIEVRKPCLL
ncbi:hypothetical protein GOODEAATRI_016811 [Goodea atripinnis]|uniref:Uncharacterized protein n=1 Tax=Goodea atripinnis TaxID=208336 RepID=A0ABV0NB66_9TELE